MAEHAGVQLVGHSGRAQPGRAASPQVIRADAPQSEPDRGPRERLLEVPVVFPEEQRPLPLRMLQRVREQIALQRQHHRHRALTRRALGAAQEDVIARDVPALRALGGAPLGGGRGDERDSRRVVLAQRAEELVDLLPIEEALARLVLGREGWQQRFDVTAPQPRALRPLQGHSQRDQLFVDGAVRDMASGRRWNQHRPRATAATRFDHGCRGRNRPLCTARGDVAVHLRRVELHQRKRAVVLAALEQADEVPCLLPVEAGRGLATLTRDRGRIYVGEHPCDGIAQRGPGLARVIGIGGVALPPGDDGRGSGLVVLPGCPPDHATDGGLKDTAVPDLAPL